MIMLCWFYCIPFAKFLYFASAPVFIIFSLFMLKRAIRASRSVLKQLSFIVIAASLMKIFLIDIRALKKDILCAWDNAYCTQQTMNLVDTLCLVTLLALLYGLYRYYLFVISKKPQKPLTPEEAQLPFWANLSICMVALMVVWQLAPWVGYLTVGAIPKIFLALPWQVLAIVNCGLLLAAFWKSENCIWDYDVAHKNTLRHLNRTWTAMDTLWTAVFIYLFTLGLSYVAHDVLTLGMQG